MLKFEVNSHSLNEFLMLVKHFDMIFLFDIPDENPLVHSGRDYEARVSSPAKVKNILSVPHQPSFGRPADDFLGTIDCQAIFTLLPDCDAFIIGSRCQEGAIGRIANNIGVFVSLAEPIEDAKVVIIGVKRTSVVDDLPYFDAPFSAFSLFLHELFVIRACRSKLIGERMEVDREDTVLEAMPADVRGIDSHKLAVDYIIVQRTIPRSLFLFTLLKKISLPQNDEPSDRKPSLCFK